MLVVMTQNQKGSPNGIEVRDYVKGQEYEMPEKLGRVFLKMGAAEMVAPKENKDAGSAPSNKSVENEEEKEQNKDDEKKKKRRA